MLVTALPREKEPTAPATELRRVGSPAPATIGAVRLVAAPPRPYDGAAAAAMTCYSARVIAPEEMTSSREAAERRDRIAERTFHAGHTTTLQHAHFQFAFHGVSRYLIWSFLHDHPHYNSEQVSQRYVRVRPDRVFLPTLSAEGTAIFLEACRDAAASYALLAEELAAPATEAYLQVFPQRGREGKIDERWRREIVKKAQEAARYVLPMATLAHLYHTVSGLTLHRYRRLSRSVECPEEVQAAVEAMCAEVEAHDPLFFRCADDPLPLESTPEYQALASLSGQGGADEEWIRAFDASLGGRLSALTGCDPGAEAILAGAVRDALGVPEGNLTDDDAIAWALDPARNRLIGDPLNCSPHDRLARPLRHVHFSFRKKLSLSADAQEQRHRALAGSRPPLRRLFLPARPDFIVPRLVRQSPRIEEIYRAAMERTWIALDRLLALGESLSSVLYLLPNAFPVRFNESGDLAGFRHKWAMRLCYTAQEEIWQSSCEEVAQVRAALPRIGARMLPPCGLRQTAGLRPFCPEGAAYCGVPVWKMDLSEYRRII